jgi:hypothetical protein
MTANKKETIYSGGIAWRMACEAILTKEPRARLRQTLIKDLTQHFRQECTCYNKGLVKSFRDKATGRFRAVNK